MKEPILSFELLTGRRFCCCVSLSQKRFEKGEKDPIVMSRRKEEKRFSMYRRSSQRRAVESLDNLWESVHEEMRNRMKKEEAAMTGR